MKYICSICDKVFYRHNDCKLHEKECQYKQIKNQYGPPQYIKYIVLDRDFDNNDIDIDEYPNAVHMYDDYYNLAPGTGDDQHDDAFVIKNFEEVIIGNNAFLICTKFTDEENERKCIKKLFEKKHEEIEQFIQVLKSNLNEAKEEPHINRRIIKGKDLWKPYLKKLKNYVGIGKL